MDLYELLALALMVGGIWLWLDSLKAREIGMQAAQRACAEEGLQFLDETVVGSFLFQLTPIQFESTRFASIQ